MTGISFTTRADKPYPTISHPIIPSWARWAARDDSGVWYFYEHKPMADNTAGAWHIDPDMDPSLAVALRRAYLEVYPDAEHGAWFDVELELVGHLNSEPWTRTCIEVRPS